MSPDPRRLILCCAGLIAGCGGAPKPPDVATSTTPCLRWQVSVDNETTFPVQVYIYGKNGRTSIGGAFPGVTLLASLDSGQVVFTPPLGVSLMVRGRDIRARFRCAERVP